MPVAIVRCEDYAEELVARGVRDCLAHLGGMESFVRPGQKVALKPNLVMKKNPREAVTTHPLVVMAVAKEVLRVGGIPLICDSPGGPFHTAKGLQGIYDICGMTEVAAKTGAGLNFDTGEKTCPHPEGVVIRSLPIITPLAEADVIINLPKLKTHSMTTYSGAVKNLYGSIPGMKKAEYHFKMPRYEDFANLLVDIYTLLKPSLNIMDGIVGMEGDGPTAGTPRKVGLLLVSENAFDLDSVCLQLIGFKEKEIPTQVAGMQRGLMKNPAEIEILGEFRDIAVIALNFKRPRSYTINFADNYLPKFLAGPLTRMLKPRLAFSPELCVGCGECARCCPAKAISLPDGRPQVEESNCIRCFCCQELCPYKAVQVEKSWLARILFGE